ncbi:NAD-dependent dehydratase [Capnocytophaga sp. HP1101]
MKKTLFFILPFISYLLPAQEGKTLLAVGATGSIGKHVVEVALADGYKVRALVRNPQKANFDKSVEIVQGDLTKPETLAKAVEGVDVIVFTHGTHGGGAEGKAVDYGGVYNILKALNGKKAYISLMTSIGVTARRGNDPEGSRGDWKRRGERLVRASGNPYTIVRPGWFDYNKADELKLVLRQDDSHLTGSPKDGVISRRQLAEVLVRSAVTPSAKNKTVELVAEKGAKTTDLEALFKPTLADKGIDGPLDKDNMPFAKEPQEVKNQLESIRKK